MQHYAQEMFPKMNPKGSCHIHGLIIHRSMDRFIADLCVSTNGRGEGKKPEGGSSNRVLLPSKVLSSS